MRQDVSMSQDAAATATATHTVTSADGTTIAYEKSGSGPALVLVDGAMCFREFGPARDVATRLADRYTVYVYDRRGRGQSGDTAPYATEREIEDLAAIIEAAGGDAFVMGQSSGAGLALEAAAAGVGMRALACYEAPYVGLRPSKDGTPRDYLGELRALLARGKRGAAVAYFMTKMVGAPAIAPVMMRLMPRVWKQLKGVAHTLEYDTMVMGRFEVPAERFATITVPTLVMAGSKGADEMKRAQRTIAEAIPGAEHRMLDGQTHQVDASVLAEQLDSFFSAKGAR